jgi:Ni,Fe-hydrogenase III small subunit/formate hydrogenlyase subunit 6/NADH:ubiquinone oxidoreductase subunit I
MGNLIGTRLRLGKRTIDLARAAEDLPDRFRGRPALDPGLCVEGCRACVEACPTGAIERDGPDPVRIDLGRCVFCPGCVEACPAGAIRYTRGHQLASTDRASLVITGEEIPRVARLERGMLRIFKRSLRLRQVSAGGAGASEAELTALGNVVFDLSRFGVQFVASPRHADGMVVTGPVSRNMALALRRTYEAIPAPKIVIAVGTEAISGGLYRGGPDVLDGVPAEIPVDLYIPGHPPHPLTILDGLLRLLGRLGEGIEEAAESK